VDEAALIKALEDGEIAGAGLDVFEQEPTPADNPLLKMDNVAVTSHYASYSEAAFTRGLTQLGEEGVRIAMGQWPMSLINPEVQAMLPPRDSARAWGTF
jgi:D-3-phosphoglycerate dehydrogenase